MSKRILLLGLGAALVFPSLSLAPAATERQSDLKTLAEIRYQSARGLFEEVWLMYTRKGQHETGVYMFSHRLMLSQLDRAENIAERVVASQHHLERMEKMRALVIKLRKIGHSNKVEQLETEYFVHEARYWLAREQERAGGPIVLDGEPRNSFRLPDGSAHPGTR
jgi:hypothetical protein